MSAVRINVHSVLGIENLGGPGYCLSVSLQMTDGQKRETVKELLGMMPTDKVADFMRNEFAELFDDAPAVVARPVATVSECEACFTPDACQLRGTCDHYAAEQLRVARTAPAPAAQPATSIVRLKPIAFASVVDIDQYKTTLEIGPHLPGVRDVAMYTKDQLKAAAARVPLTAISQQRIRDVFQMYGTGQLDGFTAAVRAIEAAGKEGGAA